MASKNILLLGLFLITFGGFVTSQDLPRCDTIWEHAVKLVVKACHIKCPEYNRVCFKSCIEEFLNDEENYSDFHRDLLFTLHLKHTEEWKQKLVADFRKMCLPIIDAGKVGDSFDCYSKIVQGVCDPSL